MGFKAKHCSINADAHPAAITADVGLLPLKSHGKKKILKKIILFLITHYFAHVAISPVPRPPATRHHPPLSWRPVASPPVDSYFSSCQHIALRPRPKPAGRTPLTKTRLPPSKQTTPYTGPHSHTSANRNTTSQSKFRQKGHASDTKSASDARARAILIGGLGTVSLLGLLAKIKV